MSARSLLFDENMSDRLRSGLSRRNPDIQTLSIGDEGAPPRGTLDPEILRWMDAHGYSLVTYNRRSMPRHLDDHVAAGGRVPGLFVINDRTPLGLAIEELLLICGAGGLDEFADCITHIPLRSSGRRR